MHLVFTIFLAPISALKVRGFQLSSPPPPLPLFFPLSLPPSPPLFPPSPPFFLFPLLPPPLFPPSPSFPLSPLPPLSLPPPLPSPSPPPSPPPPPPPPLPPPPPPPPFSGYFCKNNLYRLSVAFLISCFSKIAETIARPSTL